MCLKNYSCRKQERKRPTTNISTKFFLCFGPQKTYLKIRSPVWETSRMCHRYIGLYLILNDIGKTYVLSREYLWRTECISSSIIILGIRCTWSQLHASAAWPPERKSCPLNCLESLKVSRISLDMATKKRIPNPADNKNRYRDWATGLMIGVRFPAPDNATIEKYC